MSTIHIRIGHDHDLVITKLRDIKIISVAFGKTAAKGIDHSLDLCVGQHLVDGTFSTLRILPRIGRIA